MTSQFFQGKGGSFMKKRAKNSNKKLASCRQVRNNNAASLPIRQIAAMAKA
jgi:hypothetical protein